MRVVLPEETLPAKLTLNPEHRMSDDEYFEFCMVNPDVRFERTTQGEIVVVPCGGETAYRVTELMCALEKWSKRDRRGIAFGPTEFFLPNGAALSPDTAWVSKVQLARFSKAELQKFIHLCPEFVAEVLSPFHRLADKRAKMHEWRANGVQLGWLIDGDHRTVYIYRAGEQEPEKRTGIATLAGEGPIAGFELDLTDIWAGL